MIAIRSPSSSASSIECVVSKIILPFFIFFINCHVKRIEYGSIPLVGSSRIITCKRNKINNSTTFHTTQKKKKNTKTRTKKENNNKKFTLSFKQPYYSLSAQCQETISSSCLQKEPSQQCYFCQPTQPDHNEFNKKTLVIDHEPNRTTSRKGKEKKRKRSNQPIFSLLK